MTLNFDELLTMLAKVAPNPYLQAFLIIALFYILAKLLDIIIIRIIKKWIQRTTFTLDDQLLEIFHRPVFTSVLLVGLGLATAQLDFSEHIHFLTVSGLKTVAIFIWSIVAVRFVKLSLGLLSRDEHRFIMVQERTLPLLNNLLIILVVGLAIYFMFLVWNIDVTAWIASAGILGLAISFAAKDSLANLFSGVFIVVDAPYKLGDFIILDSGERGKVTHIGIRSTRLLTRDDVEITVPNSIMGNAKITNEAGGPHEKYRIRVKVGVAYGSDIQKVRAILLDVAQCRPDVCKMPQPRVRFRAFGDSSLEHELLCWVERPVLRGRVLHLLNTDIYLRFIDEGIDIPFPQRDVHIRTSSSTE